MQEPQTSSFRITSIGGVLALFLLWGIALQPGCGRQRTCGGGQCVANAECPPGSSCTNGCCLRLNGQEPPSSADGAVAEAPVDQKRADERVPPPPPPDRRQEQTQDTAGCADCTSPDTSPQPPDKRPPLPEPTPEPKPDLRTPEPPPERRPPGLPCDKRFLSAPTAPKSGAKWTMTFRDTPGYVFIGMSIAGPGSAKASFTRHQKINNIHHWYFSITGHAKGRYTLTFTADKGTKKIASCQLDVAKGSGGPGPCTPKCKGVLCGGNDGCGGKCAGSHRTKHGGVNDCRLPGDCGCGKEDNGNMVCGNDGKCVVRCSCDCLPPQSVDPAKLKGMNRADACKMLFRQSNDPTVWDYQKNVPLCPIDRDPQGADRCTKCPPCHRDHPPSCGWKAWCTCRDPRWISSYRQKCCANGHCF